MQVQTTHRPARSCKATVAAVSFSPAAAKLIGQIQAEARAQLLADLSAKDALTVLHGFDAETTRVRVYAEDMSISDGKGNRINLYRRLHEPESWRNSPHMAGYWHPARWYGDQTLVDANGTEWKRDLGTMVCNDFGDLVQVAE